MPGNGSGPDDLGHQLLQIFDEITSQPRRQSHGLDVDARVKDIELGIEDGAEIVSFSLDAKRYTFTCFDFFISGLGGGLRSARLGLFDDQQRQLFGATLPDGEVEVLNPGDWIGKFTQLCQSIAVVVKARRIRDPYGLGDVAAQD